ncbi:hypothetical protein ACOMHN_040778 [Nucella lapillus]
MLCVFVLALLVGLSAYGVDAVKPGFQARITQHALDYANQKALDALNAQIKGARIPDLSGNSGHLSYSLNNILIKDFNKPSSSIRLVPNVGLTWAASNAGISIHADWHAKYKIGWFKSSASGRVDVSASQVSFTVPMAFGVDSSGRPSIKSGGSSCQVGHVNVDFHGGLKWALNLFRGAIEHRVREILPGKLCEALNKLINTDAENQLKKMKVKSPLVHHLFMLDYRLVSPPSFQPAYMETYHKGEITWDADSQQPPFSPSPLPPSPSSSNMLYLWVGEYLPRSFIYAAQKHGFLRYNVTTKDLPPEAKGFLNTTCTSLTCIGLLFPPVSKKYPGHTVTMRMNSTMVPEVSMSPNRLEAKLEGTITLYVDTPSGPAPYLLTVGVSAGFNMTATIDSQLIKGKITGNDFKVKVLDSAVGPLQSKTVNTMVGLAMRFFIIPKINEQGSHGFPLPVTDDVKFVNTHLQIQQNALMIGTDLQYKFHFHL